MPDMADDVFFCTTHDFKSNISKYLRWLERDDFRAAIIKRGTQQVAMVLPMRRLERQVREEKRREREEGGEA